jgi:hypothetical protein
MAIGSTLSCRWTPGHVDDGRFRATTTIRPVMPVGGSWGITAVCPWRTPYMSRSAAKLFVCVLIPFAASDQREATVQSYDVVSDAR